MTAKLLQVNPEFYTIWNYRRNILLYGIFPHRWERCYASLASINPSKVARPDY
jgi:hypothetical protein